MGKDMINQYKSSTFGGDYQWIPIDTNGYPIFTQPHVYLGIPQYLAKHGENEGAPNLGRTGDISL